MKLNGWQRLWLVGFVPWVIVNSWIYAEIEGDWLFGYWNSVFGVVTGPMFPEPLGLLVPVLFLVIFLVYLVPYIVLYYGVKLFWCAARWVSAGFR